MLKTPLDRKNKEVSKGVPRLIIAVGYVALLVGIHAIDLLIKTLFVVGYVKPKHVSRNKAVGPNPIPEFHFGNGAIKDIRQGIKTITGFHLIHNPNLGRNDRAGRCACIARTRLNNPLTTGFQLNIGDAVTFCNDGIIHHNRLIFHG